METTGLTRKQISNFFLRQRKSQLVEPNTNRKSRESLSERFPELEQHFQTNPNPTESEKLHLMETTGLTRKQILDYFIKQRKKHQI